MDQFSSIRHGGVGVPQGSVLSKNTSNRAVGVGRRMQSNYKPPALHSCLYFQASLFLSLWTSFFDVGVNIFNGAFWPRLACRFVSSLSGLESSLWFYDEVLLLWPSPVTSQIKKLNILQCVVENRPKTLIREQKCPEIELLGDLELHPPPEDQFVLFSDQSSTPIISQLLLWWPPTEGHNIKIAKLIQSYWHTYFA